MFAKRVLFRLGWTRSGHATACLKVRSERWHHRASGVDVLEMIRLIARTISGQIACAALHLKGVCTALAAIPTVFLPAGTGLAALLLFATPAADGQDILPHSYEYYFIGNPDAQNPVRYMEEPTTVLMGGGPDVDSAFRLMIARSGGGRFVIIRSRGSDAYNAYVYAMGGVQSVETLVIPSRESANDPFVLERIRRANALFIASGYQNDYVRFWKGTGVEDAIQGLVARNVPIGGTSAGLAILGHYVFAALNGTITSDAALANPYNTRITIDHGFVNATGLDEVITETHLDHRDRMGRLVSFMARILQDGWTPMVRAIGVDVGTALVLQGNLASRIGDGSVYFLQSTASPDICESGKPLTIHNLKVQRLSGSGYFDMDRWRGYDSATTSYVLSAENGTLRSNQQDGQIY